MLNEEIEPRACGIEIERFDTMLAGTGGFIRVASLVAILIAILVASLIASLIVRLVVSQTSLRVVSLFPVRGN